MHDPFGVHVLASLLRERLESTTGVAWSTSPSGSPEPRECWLHPPDHDEASVGIFAQRCIVWVDSDARTFAIRDRDELVASMPAIESAVAAQRARFREHQGSSDEVTRLSDSVASRLQEELGRPFAASFTFRPSHAGARRGTITDVATKRAVLELGASGPRTFLRLGPGGNGAVEIESGAIASEWTRILERVSALLSGFSLRELVVNRTYRVREPIGALARGALVRFARFEDVDNHYGAYVFVDEAGTDRSVTGDFSSPQHHAFYETSRYLEPVQGR